MFSSLLLQQCPICLVLLTRGNSGISLMCSSFLLQQFTICLVLLTKGPQQYISYVFVLTSPAVSHMSGFSNKWSKAVYRLCVRPSSPAVSHMSGSSNNGPQQYIVYVFVLLLQQCPICLILLTGVHSSISLVCSSLLLQQCPICVLLVTRGQ